MLDNLSRGALAILAILSLLLILFPIVSTAQTPATPSPPAPSRSIIQIAIGVAGLATGGLAGSLVTSFLTRRRQRIEASLKLIDYYLSMYAEYGEIRGLLVSDNSLDSVQENRIRRMAKWFDIVSALWQRKIVDIQLLKDAGFDSTIKTFCRDLEDKAKKERVLEGVLPQCQHLKSLRQRLGA